MADVPAAAHAAALGSAGAADGARLLAVGIDNDALIAAVSAAGSD